MRSTPPPAWQHLKCPLSVETKSASGKRGVLVRHLRRRLRRRLETTRSPARIARRIAGLRQPAQATIEQRCTDYQSARRLTELISLGFPRGLGTPAADLLSHRQLRRRDPDKIESRSSEHEDRAWCGVGWWVVKVISCAQMAITRASHSEYSSKEFGGVTISEDRQKKDQQPANSNTKANPAVLSRQIKYSVTVIMASIPGRLTTVNFQAPRNLNMYGTARSTRKSDPARKRIQSKNRNP